MALPGLSFARGEQMHKEIHHRFGVSVTRPLSSSSFALVVAFGRCKYRLDGDSVALMLQATFGGSARLFYVSPLANRTYKFIVSSQAVGFFLVNLRSYSCESFFFTLHLWSNGGPNWRRELALFQAEEDSAWKLVNSKWAPQQRPSSFVQKGKSFAQAVRAPNANPSTSSSLTGANAVPLNHASRVASATPSASFQRQGAPPSAEANAPPLTGANAIPVKQPRFSSKKSNFFESSQQRPAQLANSSQAGKSLADHGVPSATATLCPRCLLTGHDRAACSKAIRCLLCYGWGHIAVNCVNSATSKGKHGAGSSNSRLRTQHLPGQPSAVTDGGPSCSNPPVFRSFNEMASALALKGTWAAKKAVHEFIAGQASAAAQPNTVQLPHSSSPPDPLLLSLSLAPSSPSLFTPSTRENPSPPAESFPPGNRSNEQEPGVMAFQRADPRPFTPPNFRWIDVPDRMYMCRAVAPSRPPAANEDLAIVNLHPLPAGNELNFGAVTDLVRQFLFQRGMHPRGIYRCHLGQAYVRFRHAFERDNMINLSPMPVGNINISFTRHNEGRNHRRVFFNEECWVMLLGFPDDYKNDRHVQNAVSGFGRLILYEVSEEFPGRVMARVRITNLQEVPHFIVYSDSTNVQGDSWTVQCEIMQHNDIGVAPPLEDPVPDELEMGEDVPFDFFGLGQPVNHGQDQDQDQQQQDQAPDQQHQDGLQNVQAEEEQNLNLNLNFPQQPNPWEPWPAWPAEIPAQQAPAPAQQLAQQQAQLPAQLLAQQQVQQQVPVGPNLNMEAQIELPDLNDPANDPQEVVINPAPPQNIGFNAFVELNDFMDEVDQVIPIPQQIQNVDQAIQQVDEDMLQIADAFPNPQIPDVLGDEIPADQLLEEGNLGLEEGGDGFDPDQLVGPGEEGFPLFHPVPQLPLNPVELDLMELADQEQQLVAEGMNVQLAGQQQEQEQQLEAEGMNVQLAGQQQGPPHLQDVNGIQNQHMQIGFALMPFDHWNSVSRAIERNAQINKSVQLWETLISKDSFSWAKQFLASGAAAFLDDNQDAKGWGVSQGPTEAGDKQIVEVAEEVSNTILTPPGQKGQAKKKRSNKRQTPLVETEFCSMKPEELEEQRLSEGGSKGTIGRKKARTQEGKPAMQEDMEGNADSN